MSLGPCWGCKDRYPACHGSCPRYAEWREPWDKAAEERRKSREAEELLCDGRFRGHKKYKRGWGKK